MPVKKEPSGRRSVDVEVEVPGTPEEVWEAIATGPGISSWFVPSTVEGREGGATKADFGPGMVSEGTVKAWEPPHRYVVETTEGPGAVATEWIVEARSGGTCVVRVVHSWFADSDDWDDEFEGHAHGWNAFFRILRVYLTHFGGQPCSTLQLMGTTSGPVREAWQTLLDGLGARGAEEGEQREAPAGTPSFGGVIEAMGDDAHPELLVRMEKPAPGIAHGFAMQMGEQVIVPMRLYLYGDEADGVIDREEGSWQRWMRDRFGQPSAAS